MQIGVKEAAQKLLRDYGAEAGKECDARAAYYDAQGDTAVADGWRRVKEYLQAKPRGR